MNLRIRPIMALFGILLVGVGIWLIYHPAAYIFGGICLCLFSVLQGKPPKDEVK